MRARVYQTCKNGMYYGQVWNYKLEHWSTVTTPCFTEWGAKLELERWKKKNFPEEFEI